MRACSHTITLVQGQTWEFTHIHIQNRGHHNTSLLHSSQISLTVAQGDAQSPLLPIGLGHDWGLDLGSYLVEESCLVSWSMLSMSPARAQPYGDSECQSKRESRKPPSLALPHLSLSSATLSQPSHWCSVSRGRCGWNLPGASRNVAEVRPSRSTTLGGWENSGLLSQ